VPAAEGVHHRGDVVHAILERPHRDAVREASAALVEEDETGKTPQPLKVGHVGGVLPHVLEMADPSGHDNEVERPRAENLECDVDAVPARVLGLRVLCRLGDCRLDRATPGSVRRMEPSCDVTARVKAELVSNLLDVIFSGALGDDQPLGNVAVRKPVGNELGDLLFAPA
jgi:hypothetical protein